DLQKGEVHALCGENGAGKSTLIKILCGFYPTGSYQGEILLNGQPVHFKNLRAAEEHGIALIAQELALVPELSIAENLVLGREPVRAGLIQWDRVRAEARRALALVGLDVDPDRKVKELGIGQQQMVEIAKALAKNAEILVLDEPTAALTEADAQRLLRFLSGLRAKGVSSIYISHRLEEVFQIADRITVLRDGRSVATAPTAQLTTDRVIALMVGREVKNLYPRPPHREGAPLLKVERWSVEDPLNPGRLVLRDVSFEVRQGEVLGIAGLMGAGRTALVSSLFGASRWAGNRRARPFARPPTPSPPAWPWSAKTASAMGWSWRRRSPRTSRWPPCAASPTAASWTTARARRRRGRSSRPCASRPPACTRWPTSSPAATSRRWCWPSGSWPTRACSSSTSRP